MTSTQAREIPWSRSKSRGCKTIIDGNKRNITVGKTPLFIASYKGDIQVVQKLLNQIQIDVNKASAKDGLTPLWIASQEGHTQVVQMLLNHTEIDVNKAKTDASGETPLITAIRIIINRRQYSREHSDIAELLLNHSNIDVNKKRTSDGAPPLWVAANIGDWAAGKEALHI